VTAAPGLAIPAVAILGVGLGAIFPLALTLPVDLARRSDEVGGLAAIMLFGGYILASLAPLVLGLVRDVSGGFDIGLWSLVAIAGFLVAVCWWLVPAGLGRRTATPAAA
jgi:CP family cyanate transporter-like MFS transporter